MKFILAPDSFKESLNAMEIADAMERGFRKVFPYAQYIKVPMADGGEGTTQSLVNATGGEMHYPEVTNPLGKKIRAELGILGNKDIAVIEMASASGLELVNKSDRNPLVTTTFGTGELIMAALDKGVNTIIIGIGGSATNDGGIGMIQALGGRLLDENGKQIEFGGGAIDRLRHIDLSNLDPRVYKTNFEVACDVDNPLTGVTGASYVYGAQKGATPEVIQILDSNLKHYAKIIKNVLDKDVDKIPGAGAAGGMGAGLMAFLDAKLYKGFDIVLKYTNLEHYIIGADFVITGEGSIDEQTRFGKTPYGVAITAQKHNVPVIAIAGSISNDVNILYDYGFQAFFTILRGVSSLDEAINNAEINIQRTCENIGRLIKINYKE